MLDMKSALFKFALAARTRAYAPYSEYKVGAAVQTKSGKVYAGCNVENSSYGMTICAERAAIINAVIDGETEFTKLCLIVENPLKQEVLPCGACRQFMAEFGTEWEIHTLNIANQVWYHTTLDVALPISGKIL